MHRVDIRQYKTNLRTKFKTMRSNMPPEVKVAKDKKIIDKIINLSNYKSSEMLITYVSTPVEINTISLIEKAFADNKRVVVPKCIENYMMDFYEITSMDDLEKGTFSVLEPIIDKCKKVTDYRNSICIIPGLAFDKFGYRLGYGKGYYDRFLNSYKGIKIGLCYDNFIEYRLPKGRYDVAVNMVVTDKKIMNIL